MNRDGIDPDDRPSWWDENQKLRDRFDLPDYDAPRFLDGSYTHEVVPALEDRFDCEIRFVGLNVRYPEDWTVRIDNRYAFDIPCRRTKDGNTIYQMNATEFRDRVERELTSE